MILSMMKDKKREGRKRAGENQSLKLRVVGVKKGGKDKFFEAPLLSTAPICTATFSL